MLTRVLAHALLRPYPFTGRDGELLTAAPRAVMTARAVLLHLGVAQVQQIADPGPSGQPAMDSILLNQGRVAVRLGVARRPTVSNAVGLLRASGALVHVKDHPMGARFRVGRVADRVQAALLGDTVDACLDYLFDTRDDRPLPALDVQAVLTACTHPTFAYPAPRERGSRKASELDLTARLILIADAVSGESGMVHVDPVNDWAVSAAGAKNARTNLMRAGCYDADADMAETLTAYGRQTGALARAAEAEQERAAAAAQQVDAVTAARQRAKKARAIVKKTIGVAETEVGVRVPGPADQPDLRPVWAKAVHAQLVEVDQELRVAVRRELTRKLTAAGHTKESAQAVASKLCPDQPTTAQAA